ncbi:sugar ABC transporter permease [Streptomyces sp. WAC 06738]|uniref:carbohydrate ABC transporter permease n=1 Tax=Streptomyces sp. WAC 06738 TaxID=2203210 RepID=UPI000F71E392|nr:sugar ABC transporter permease [Streptomyces sp. WAC 06738]AZM49262.1 sugar ABC transporter permease [Streptomyces sp. WAC 06738]
MKRPGAVPWLFVVPAAAVTLLILLVPSLVGAAYAFTDWDGLTSPSWVGLGNFTEFFGDGSHVVAQTLILAALYVVGVNAAGLGLALGLAHTLRTRHVLRALFLVPAVVSPLVVAYVWTFILDVDGPLNELLEAVGLGSSAQPWLGQRTTALLAVAVVMVWQFAGYHMLIYLAGLQGVQRELLEAAEVDGAGPWRRFADITLPLLRPALVIGTVLATISAFLLFDQVMALTGGGPSGGTDTLGTYVYEQTFVNGRFGYGSAVALLLVAGVSLVALVQTRLLRGRRP